MVDAAVVHVGVLVTTTTLWRILLIFGGAQTADLGCEGLEVVSVASENRVRICKTKTVNFPLF